MEPAATSPRELADSGGHANKAIYVSLNMQKLCPLCARIFSIGSSGRIQGARTQLAPTAMNQVRMRGPRERRTRSINSLFFSNRKQTCEPGVLPAIPRKVSSAITLCLYTMSYLWQHQERHIPYSSTLRPWSRVFKRIWYAPYRTAVFVNLGGKAGKWHNSIIIPLCQET